MCVVCVSAQGICARAACVRVFTSHLLSCRTCEQAMCCLRVCGSEHLWCMCGYACTRMCNAKKLSVWECAPRVQALLGDSVLVPLYGLGAVCTLMLSINLHSSVYMCAYPPCPRVHSPPGIGVPYLFLPAPPTGLMIVAWSLH